MDASFPQSPFSNYRLKYVEGKAKRFLIPLATPAAARAKKDPKRKRGERSGLGRWEEVR